MGVKTILNNVEISQSKLSERLNLSRPTMTTYLKLYEDGKKIPKERYDIIFHRLFDNEEISKSQFEMELECIERLFERDDRFEIANLKPREADYAFKTYKLMTDDLYEDDYDKTVYIFINNMLSSYRKQNIWKYLAHYICTLNGITNTADVKEEEKPYFVAYYKTFTSLLNDSTNYLKEDYEAFIKRCRELQNERDNKARLMRKKVNEALNEVMTQNHEVGIEMSQEELMECVGKKLQGETI